MSNLQISVTHFLAAQVFVAVCRLSLDAARRDYSLDVCVVSRGAFSCSEATL